MIKKRDFLSVLDLSGQELKYVLRLAKTFKNGRVKRKPLHGKTIALLFEKPSLRTRVTFEVSVSRLGGKTVYLSPLDVQMGKRESAEDIARNLSLWVHGIAARVFSHKTLQVLSSTATVPVVNALSDLEHPCQALADLLTIQELKKDFKKVKLCYLGDGNNVCHSLLLSSALVGLDMAVATPVGFEPFPDIVGKAKGISSKNGSSIFLSHDAQSAVRGADFVYTDVWTSMGQERESGKRKNIFPPYQVNAAVLRSAKPACVVLHCLPAHRGEEITGDIIDGSRSAIWRQAENRLHTTCALLHFLFSRK